MKNRYYLAVFFFALNVSLTLAQDIITLKNPSFDVDLRRPSTEITGWIWIGEMKDSPPDIQPGSWGVTKKAKQGCCYAGLVVRDNGTWEGLGQVFKSALVKDSSYTFSLWLCVSEEYKSRTPESKEKVVNFDTPAILKIWGYNTATEQEELLAESAPIKHGDWREYSFVLTPTLANFNEIDLTAFYSEGNEKTNGHILMDNCSALVLKKNK
jgi:hypothetical protein